MNTIDNKVKSELEQLRFAEGLIKVSEWRLHNSAEGWTKKSDEKFLAFAKNNVEDFSDLFNRAAPR